MITLEALTGLSAASAPGKFINNGKEYTIKNYNSKEMAILGGYSVCRGIAHAFKDICQGLGIDCEVVSNKYHGWNMVYTDEGPKYIDCSLAVEHFKGNPTLKKVVKRDYSPYDYFLVDMDRLMQLERMPGRICYPHGDGKIFNEKKVLFGPIQE